MITDYVSVYVLGLWAGFFLYFGLAVIGFIVGIKKGNSMLKIFSAASGIIAFVNLIWTLYYPA